jgi:two-component system, OmpR family, alkaline phosphatase synthesis response regulator PhoP
VRSMPGVPGTCALHSRMLRTLNPAILRAPVEGDGTDLGTARILLVDDNPQNVELLEAYLEEIGCELRKAFDGPEALADVEKFPPDLILLDIMMPRMSGFQVCKKLRASALTEHIPVIMVTALNELADAEHAVEVGATDFITKPVNKAELLLRVRAQLKLALVKKQLQRAMLEARKG